MVPELADEIVRGRDDVAAALVRLIDVQCLSRARPEDPRRGKILELAYRALHQWDRVDTGICDSTREDGNDHLIFGVQQRSEPGELLLREDGGHIQLELPPQQPLDEAERGLTPCVCDWDL